MDSIHDRLIKEVQLYFAAHLVWETKKTHKSAKEVRRRLSEIRRLASQRRVEVQMLRKPKGIPRGDNIGKYNSDLKEKKDQDTN